MMNFFNSVLYYKITFDSFVLKFFQRCTDAEEKVFDNLSEEINFRIDLL